MSSDTSCKACHLPVNEEKLYGLGEHRWHMDCFKCSKCQKNLSQETNLLAIGEGTLLCSSCNYKCAICGKQIADMAVLTTEQAFCASCFKCRNCHKRIEDLQYAKTSHGIFCMACHHSLLERKRQRKAEKLRDPNANSKQAGPIATERPQLRTQLSARSNDSQSLSNSNSKTGSPNVTFSENNSVESVSSSVSAVSEQRPGFNEEDNDAKVDVRGGSNLSINSGNLVERGKVFKIPRKQLAPSAFADSATTSTSTSVASGGANLTPNAADPANSTAIGNANGTFNGSLNTLTPNANMNPFAPPSAPPIVSLSGNGAGTGTGVVSERSSDRAPEKFSEKFNEKMNRTHQRSDSNFLRAPFPTSPKSITTIRSVSSPTSIKQPTATPNRNSDIGSPSSVRSPISKFLHFHTNSRPNSPRESRDLKDPKELQISSPVHVHKRSVSENSVSDENIDLREMYLNERRRAEDLTDKLQSMIDAYGSIEVMLDETRKLREVNKMLTQRNAQLHDLNAELEKLTLEKFGPNTLWGSLNPPFNSANNFSGGSSGATHTQNSLNTQSSNEGFGSSKNRSFVTVLDEPEPSQSKKSTKNWLFRRPHKSQTASSTSANSNLTPSMHSETSESMNSVTVISSPESQNDTQGANGNVSGAVSGAVSGPMSGPMNGIGNGPMNGLGNGPMNGLGNAPMNGGMTPSESLKSKAQSEGTLVPYFVTRCIAEIEKRGLEVEGIYRKPGSKLQVDSLLQQFGSTGDAKLGEELISNGEVQAITSALKQYLRRLAEPVITFDCYETFIAAGNSHNINVLSKAIANLPMENFETLRVVMAHLAEVIKFEDINLMNTKNLAMVFAPTIARDLTGEREIPDMQARNDATHMLITNQAVLLDPNVRELQ